jgi:hypothetical protein
LAAGSKYTLALVALPVLLAIGFYFTGARKAWVWAAALATMAATFFAVVPYSLIDIPNFLNGLASETWHYASGHSGFNAEPGLPQLLFYLRHLVSEFGVAAILAVIGVVAYVATDWRRSAILTIFPAALLWLLASQRVHFVRNVLSLHPLIAMFAAFGLISLHGWVVGLAARRGWVPKGIEGRARILAGLVLLIATVPLWHIAGHLRDRTDSRNLAEAWIEERVPPNWTIVAPKQLNFDARRLEKAGRRVMVVDLKSALNHVALGSLLGEVPAPAVIMVPKWGADRRYEGGQEQADALNNLSGGRQVLKTFGTNAVLVNYSSPTPWGDPAFTVAILK